MAEALDGSQGGARGQEIGRALTEALHGIRAEDLAGSLRPEVVTGNIFTVAPTEHQLVAVFFLLRFQILVGQDPSFRQFLSGPLSGAQWPLQAWWGGATLSLSIHYVYPTTDLDSWGGIWDTQGRGITVQPSLHTPILLPWDEKCLVPSCKAQNRIS